MYLADVDNLDKGFVGQGQFGTDVDELMRRATATQSAAQAAKQEVTEVVPKIGATALGMGAAIAFAIYWFLIR